MTSKQKWEVLKDKIQKFVDSNSEYDDRFIYGSCDRFYSEDESYYGFWCNGESHYDIVSYYQFQEYGISAKFNKFLQANGMYHEWYDCGTLMIYID